jgi:hypothetical protein
LTWARSLLLDRGERIIGITAYSNDRRFDIFTEPIVRTADAKPGIVDRTLGSHDFPHDHQDCVEAEERYRASGEEPGSGLSRG